MTKNSFIYTKEGCSGFVFKGQPYVPYEENGSFDDEEVHFISYCCKMILADDAPPEDGEYELDIADYDPDIQVPIELLKRGEWNG